MSQIFQMTLKKGVKLMYAFIMENTIKLASNNFEEFIYNLENYVDDIFIIERHEIKKILADLVNEKNFLSIASLATSLNDNYHFDFYLSNKNFEVVGISGNESEDIIAINEFFKENDINAKVQQINGEINI